MAGRRSRVTRLALAASAAMLCCLAAPPALAAPSRVAVELPLIAARPFTAPSAPPAPAPVPGMDVYAQGQDGGVWFAGWTGAGWGSWNSLGGPFASAPSVASWGPGRLDVFVTGPDKALWHRWFDGGQWSDWSSLGGGLASAPTVVSWGPGRLDIFAQGLDHQLWHLWWAGGWSGWWPLGGGLASAPSAASWAPGRLDVVARGLDNQLWHLWWAGGWSGWWPLGGGLTADPAATSWGPNRLDLFARGLDGQLWHLWWAGGWSGWWPLGGSLTTGPGAASWGPGQLDVFAAGQDHGVWHLRWGSSGWSGWQSVGGTVTSSPQATPWSAVTNTIAGVPYQQQVFALTCEEAALEMVLARQGVNVTQDQVLQVISVDPRPGFVDSAGVLHWGNPNTSFVGDKSGSEVALTGYGTYQPTIAMAAMHYGVNVIRNGVGIPPQDIYAAILTNHPVVAWVAFDWRFHSPGTMVAWDGSVVQWEGPIEHAVTLVGVSQDSVLVDNPWPSIGQQWVSKATFEAAYATYHDMAVIVQ